MNTSPNIFIILGVALIVMGLLFSGKLGIGRLPGDIVASRPGVTFYFPIMTMIILSIALTIIFRLFGK